MPRTTLRERTLGLDDNRVLTRVRWLTFERLAAATRTRAFDVAAPSEGEPNENDTEQYRHRRSKQVTIHTTRVADAGESGVRVMCRER
jgi:hypothetical protein